MVHLVIPLPTENDLIYEKEKENSIISLIFLILQYKSRQNKDQFRCDQKC